MTINSFSFVATKPCHREADILIWSIRQFYEQPIVVLCDSPTAEHLSSRGHQNIVLKIQANPEQMNRDAVRHLETFNRFHNKAAILKKMDVIKIAVDEYSNTMFFDADIVLTDEIHQDINKPNMFSPHYFHLTKEHQSWNYGAFNAGYVFVSDPKFHETWKKIYLSHSRFYEQEGMALLFGHYEIGKFNKKHNIGRWRVQNPSKIVEEFLFPYSIHCHFDPKAYLNANKTLSHHFKSWSEYWIDKVNPELRKYIKDAINLG